MEVPNYGPGAGLLGTAAATLARLDSRNLSSPPSSISPYPSFIDTYVSENVGKYLQDIENLKEENEALKNKLDLLEIQFKFLLNKFTELEKFMESGK